MTIVTLLTDFGTADSYVAELKGVLLARAPAVTIVDISHQIAPGDIGAGQYLLGRAWKTFPQGTVHLAVVDPGVGTDARAIGAESGGHRFFAPITACSRSCRRTDDSFLCRFRRARLPRFTAETSSRPWPRRSRTAHGSRSWAHRSPTHLCPHSPLPVMTGRR